MPVGACDAHCHILGPHAVFPYAADRTFTPYDAPKEAVFARHDELGISRAVAVQSSCYGSDHSALLDALRAAPDRLRGVALLDAGMTPADVLELHEAGVRGYRLNFLPHLPGAGDDISSLLEVAHGLDWHAEVHVHGDGIQRYAERIRTHPGRVVIDHMARVDLREGLDGPSVRALLDLLGRGHVWVKVSGVDRLSRVGPPWPDAAALAALLVDAAPERVLWGTDYPHVNIASDPPDDGLLVDVLAEAVGDSTGLRRVLVDNPAEFFDFAAVDAGLSRPSAAR